MLNSGYHFKIADPNSPCVVTVAMFYGKGYFVLRTSLLCGVTLNMSIEFGAGVELHPWKLASLSASISAGIHFELNTDNVVRLVGYFSCHGSLHVLGVGFNVGLDAAFELINGYILHVYVNLHVETDLLFFSIGVDVPVEFSFAGRPLSGGSLQHGLALPLRQHFGSKCWNAYCEAFAYHKKAQTDTTHSLDAPARRDPRWQAVSFRIRFAASFQSGRPERS